MESGKKSIFDTFYDSYLHVLEKCHEFAWKPTDDIFSKKRKTCLYFDRVLAYKNNPKLIDQDFSNENPGKLYLDNKISV